jgi:hypothetical protein
MYDTVQYNLDILENCKFKGRITKEAVKYCIIFDPFTTSYCITTFEVWYVINAHHSV